MPASAAPAGEYSSDEILVERIAAGDKLAMQVLFARHRTKIFRWLLRFVGDETVAEDLLSDVFFDERGISPIARTQSTHTRNISSFLAENAAIFNFDKLAPSLNHIRTTLERFMRTVTLARWQLTKSRRGQKED